jgi:hypothetical protein
MVNEIGSNSFVKIHNILLLTIQNEDIDISQKFIAKILPVFINIDFKSVIIRRARVSH